MYIYLNCRININKINLSIIYFWNLQVRGLQQHTDIKDMAAIAALVIVYYTLFMLHLSLNLYFLRTF